MEGNSKRRLVKLLGNLLIGLGMLLLLATGGAYAYSYYQEWQIQSDPWLAQLQEAYAERKATATPAQASAVASSSDPSPSTSPVQTATPTPRLESPAPAATPRGYSPPVGISIPGIKVQSRVVAVGIKDGEYVVPKFYVGHFEGSAKPGQQGNGLYMGHVESLSSGNVFARLPEIKLGSEITLYTDEQAWTYSVVKTQVVRYDDVSVVAPTADQRITLITCTGDWDASLRQYTERFIAIAELVQRPTTGEVTPAAR